jgi:hypothetical protein
MNRPMSLPSNDRFPGLVYAYIGPNGAHRNFRVAISNAKALSYVLARNNAAVLSELLKQADEARQRSRDGHFALGMAGGRSTTTSVQMAIHLTGNEIALIEAEPGGFKAQALGLVYREVYRVFETFLVDLFGEVARTDKRILYSSQKLTHEEALRAGTPAVLHDVILERRKAELTRGGLAHLERTFKDIGLPLMGQEPLNAEQQHARARLVFLSAARNVIEHNRSVVNDEFIALVPDAEYERGQTLIITTTTLGDALSAAESVADGLNRRAVGKFGLCTEEEPPNTAMEPTART